METAKNIPAQIKHIFDNNVISDLQRFMKKRQCLNETNMVLVYLFHIVQSLGILSSSYSASTGDPNFLWAGIGLNMFASIIQIYEKINSDQIKRIYMDIQAIKNGTYLDESQYLEMESGQKTSQTNGSSSNLSNNNLS
jgi:hypothetical protein